MSIRSPQGAAPVFAALGDPTRLQVVDRLSSGGPSSIAVLTTGCGVSRQAVAKHLRVLAEAGLVRGWRRGRESVWELETRQLAEARQYLDAVSGQWEAALGRLKAFVEQ
ncbi:MAG: transcriptional regulator, arsr family [Gemmatimonadetes bacterium]|nr:transcriptional regulator, arsr family [Gemmatimonadota bacterium]